MPEIAKLTKHLRDVPFALTLDCAPTVQHDRVPQRMDQLREALVRIGVRDCAAFVTGEAAEGHEDVLERWLEAGFELGNQTFHHRRASELEPDAFVADVARCDRLLESVGAFRGDRQRLFRFPGLDRGRRRHRDALDQKIRDLGYTVAHASLDWFDHGFDDLWQASHRNGDPDTAAAIEDRCVMSALRAALFEARRARAMARRRVTQVARCRCNETATRCLPQVVIALRESGVRFCSIHEALRDDVYQRFDRRPLDTGRVLAALAPSKLTGFARRALVHWSRQLGLFGQKRLGPLWPYFE